MWRLAFILLLLAAGSDARAQAVFHCYAKDQVIAALGPGTHAVKLNGDDAAAFRLVANEVYADDDDPEGTSYVIAWRDGLENNAARVFIFDVHNCYAEQALFPKWLVAPFIGERA